MLSRVVVLVLIGVILFLGLYAISKQPKYNPPKPRDPDHGPIFEDCLTVKDGQLQLHSCTDDAGCKACKGNAHSCLTVDAEHPLKYRNSDGKEYDVPDGKWCVPQVQQSESCNRFTGAYVLARAGDSYAWVCECTNPKLFDKESYWGDCVQEIACLSQIGGGELVCPPGATNCTPGQSWLDSKNWDPATGICKCDSSKGYVTSSDQKYCVKTGCSPGTDRGDGTCDCPTDELSCPGQIPETSWYSSQCDSKHPICITDPCQPGGTFDANSGICVCNEGQGYYNERDPQSIVGYHCKKLCTSENNPCSNRGTCEVDVTCIRKVQSGQSTGISSSCVGGAGLNQCMNCTNCRRCGASYQQDSCNMCNSQCIPDNADCDSDGDCCSGRCHTTWYPYSRYCHKCDGP